MKKVLLGTSAIALAGAFANSAHAAEWNVRVGGYSEQQVGYANSNISFAGDPGDFFPDDELVDYDGVDLKSDTEVHFIPSITLDNGLQIGADVQIEGDTGAGAGSVDEQFVFVEGAFGRMLLGAENSAGYLLSYGAPDVTFFGASSGSLPNFVPLTGAVNGIGVGNDYGQATLGTAAFLENAANSDAQRITYFTPRFAGLQLGASYARDSFQCHPAGCDTQANLNGDPLHDIFDVGANFVHTLGPVDIAASGRWGIADSDTLPGQPTVWSAGLNLGFGGVTVGGAFGEQNEAGASDGQAWEAGIAYETGPWGVSFAYAHGENVNDERVGLVNNDETLDQYVLGARYTVAQGVALNAYGAYGDFDEEVGEARAAGDDVSGWVLGTGIRISW